MADTTRLGLRDPQGADDFTIADDISQIVNTLDDSALDLQGTLASRPAANTVPAGTYYFATDLGDLSRSNGTTWFTVTPAARSAFAATAADQTISAGATTKISWTTEEHDLGSDFGSSKFTAPVKGIYEFHAKLAVNTATSGDLVQLLIYVDGSPHSTHSVLSSGAYPTPTSVLSGTIELQLNAGQYVEIYVTNSSAGSKHTGTTVGQPPRFHGKLLAQIP